MTVLERYREAVEKDLSINQFNVREVQMRAPARKHYWVARMIDAKIDLGKRKRQKKYRKHELVKELIERAPTKLSLSAAGNAVENSKELKSLNTEIIDLEILVEYLTEVVKIMTNIHWEIKNIIELMQMEMT